MLPAIKYVFTDTIIMTDFQFYVILTVCFALGFPVGAILYAFTEKFIRRFWK